MPMPHSPTSAAVKRACSNRQLLSLGAIANLLFVHLSLSLHPFDAPHLGRLLLTAAAHTSLTLLVSLFCSRCPGAAGGRCWREGKRKCEGKREGREKARKPFVNGSLAKEL